MMTAVRMGAVCSHPRGVYEPERTRWIECENRYMPTASIDEIDALVEYLFSMKPKPAAGSPAAKDDF